MRRASGEVSSVSREVAIPLTWVPRRRHLHHYPAVDDACTGDYNRRDTASLLVEEEALYIHPSRCCCASVPPSAACARTRGGSSAHLLAATWEGVQHMAVDGWHHHERGAAAMHVGLASALKNNIQQGEKEGGEDTRRRILLERIRHGRWRSVRRRPRVHRHHAHCARGVVACRAHIRRSCCCLFRG